MRTLEEILIEKVPRRCVRARARVAKDMADEKEKFCFPILLLGFRSPWQESKSPGGYRIMN